MLRCARLRSVLVRFSYPAVRFALVRSGVFSCAMSHCVSARMPAGWLRARRVQTLRRGLHEALRYRHATRGSDRPGFSPPGRDRRTFRCALAVALRLGGPRRGEESDVDVPVRLEGPTTFDRHMGLLILLADLLGRRVDVLTATGIEPRLRPLIDQDLVVSRDVQLSIADVVAAGEPNLRR